MFPKAGKPKASKEKIEIKDQLSEQWKNDFNNIVNSFLKNDIDKK